MKQYSSDTTLFRSFDRDFKIDNEPRHVYENKGSKPFSVIEMRPL